MPLDIYYGSSISKRTEKIYEYLLGEAVRHTDRNYVMLVPEQASLTVQQELVEAAEDHALLNIDVLTFNRLAYRVFRDVCEPEKNVLDDAGKLMLLRLVLLQHEEELGILRRNLRKEGFLEEMKSVISELAQYDISPEELLAGAEKVSDYPVLQAKLKDIALIYRAFLELIHRNYEMAEERMSRLAKDLGKWANLSQTTFALEGFTGFTPPQYEVLTELLHGSAGVILGVPLGSGRDVNANQNEEDLFHMSFRMADSMKKIAEKANIIPREFFIDDDASFDEVVRHIEKNLFVYPRQKFGKEAEAIRILKARNQKEEVRFVLSRILESVRNGNDFRDMAIICGNPEEYREELEDQFRAAGVPCFVDADYRLDNNPLLLLVGNVLEVLDSDFSFDLTVNYMKNPLMVAFMSNQCGEDGLSPYERICEVENYILSLGIRGKNAYERTFSRKTGNVPAGRLPIINNTKEILLRPILKLERSLKNSKACTEEKIIALVSFLEEVGAYGIMQKIAENCSDSDILLKREYERTYELLMGLFDRMDRILGESILTEEEFSDVLSAGMAEMNIGMVPPTKDRLVVGDLKRTRLGKIKQLYILGANEGVFPPKGSERGLLSESDREALEQIDMHLAPTVKQENFFSQYYLYLMLTKPTESLTISYILADNEGKALLPSYIVGMLQSMFDLQVTSAVSREGCLAVSEAAGREILAESLREYGEDQKIPSPEARALYAWFSGKEDGIESIDRLFTGLFYRYREEELSESVARHFFRDVISGSVSRLEKFASCAFAHFLNYGLELREREIYEVDAGDIGTVLHDSISEFFSMMKENGKEWKDLTEEEQNGYVKECVHRVTEREENEVLRDSARNAYLIARVERIVGRTIRVLSRQWRAGDYSETSSEKVFSAEIKPDALQIPLGDGLYMALNGRIDRMDIAEKEEEVYVKIIDYKSGRNKTDFTKIYYGLQLQLLIYLEAAQAIAEKEHPGKKIVPAGVYYYHIDDPIVDYSENADPENLIYDELRIQGITNVENNAYKLIDRDMNGKSEVVYGLKELVKGGFNQWSVVTDGDGMSRLGQFALNKAETLAKEMAGGKIAVNPYSYKKETSCTYCPYRSVCAFDSRVSGFSRQKLIERELKDFMPEEEPEFSGEE